MNDEKVKELKETINLIVQKLKEKNAKNALEVLNIYDDEKLDKILRQLRYNKKEIKMLREAIRKLNDARETIVYLYDNYSHENNFYFLYKTINNIGKLINEIQQEIHKIKAENFRFTKIQEATKIISANDQNYLIITESAKLLYINGEKYEIIEITKNNVDEMIDKIISCFI
ncbi:MAG: hypothetical protein ACP5G1_02225 [Nanopusillaceae archaeon]